MRFRGLAIAVMCAVTAMPIEAAQGDSHQASLPPRLVATGQEQAAATLGLSTDARTLHRELDEVMRRYPPALGQILRLDPTLMTNPTYLAPYPVLQTFLTAHPDVMKNPTYYFGDNDGGRYYEQDSPTQRIVRQVLDGIAMLTIFGTIVAVVTWLIRLLVDYRRWNRLAKVQAEAHTKLLDRFTANDELIAYVQSPAGNRFLQSAPIALDPGTRRLGAPISRILWSAQVGLVVMMAGFGFQYVSGHVDADAQQPLYAIGTVALFIGLGFLLSAGVSYLLSHRLNLFDPPAGAAGPTVVPVAGPRGPEA
jgi:hypothetical protein